MKAFSVSANEWLYPDIDRYDSARPDIDLHAPRGGWAAVQLFFPQTKAGQPIAVDYRGGLQAPECYLMEDVRCLYNTNDNDDPFAVQQGVDTSAWTTRQTPFRAYDALRPFERGGNVTQKEATALYLAFKISPDRESGVYPGVITVDIGGERATFDVSITVHKVCLPERGRLSTTNWYNAGNMAFRYGFEMYDENWFGVYKKLLALMRRTRQTHLIIPLSLIDIAEDEPGRFSFDFSLVGRVCQLAMDMGFSTLELGHLFHKNYITNEAYYLFYRPEGKLIYGDTPEGYNFLSQFLPEWTRFLREKRWYEKSVQHVGDEPAQNMIDNYRVLAGVVRKFMPGIKLFDAVVHPELRGAVDYFIPLNSYYEQMRDEFETLRAQGDELWFYTACGPGGKYLNRMIDLELLRPRLLHWGNFLYDLKGYLHWGFNYWGDDQPDVNEFANAVINDGHTLLPPGDTHICYPGDEAGPWMSIRLEKMREGVEDCELLYMLADFDPAKADEYCKSMMRSFTDYVTDPIAFDRNYAALLTELDRLAEGDGQRGA